MAYDQQSQASKLAQCLQRLDTLTDIALRQEKEIKKVYKLCKNSSTSHSQAELFTEVQEIHDKVEDVQNWMNENVNEIESLKMKSKRMYNMLRNITKNMNLPVDQFGSDTDSSTRKRHFGYRGNRARRIIKHRQQESFPESPKSSDSSLEDRPSVTPQVFGNTTNTTTIYNQTTPPLLVPNVHGRRDRNLPSQLTPGVEDSDQSAVNPTQDVSVLQSAIFSSNQELNRTQPIGLQSQPRETTTTTTDATSQNINQAFINNLGSKQLLPSSRPDSLPQLSFMQTTGIVTMATGSVTASSPNILVSGKSHFGLGSGQLKSKNTLLSTPSVENIEGQQESSYTPNIPVEDVATHTQTPEGAAVDVPDFSSSQKFLESLSIPVNDETKAAISQALSVTTTPQFERPIGLYTVLLVDSSNSIDQTARDQISDFIAEFIDEVEDSAGTNQLEENVAMVTFGENVTIQKEFTNDFSDIHDAYLNENVQSVGRSPMLTGLATCLAYMHKTGKTVDLKSVQLYPRVVLLTDGLITDDNEFKGVDFDKNSINTKAKMMKFLKVFQQQKYPLFCVGVGKNSDQAFLRNVATECAGKLVDRGQARTLGKYYLYQMLVSNIKNTLNGRGQGADVAVVFQNIVRQNRGRLSRPNDQEELIAMLAEHGIIVSAIENIQAETQVLSDGEEFKDYDLQDMPSMPPIGSRVKRGPHWGQGDNDGRGHGTVMAHVSEGVMVVKWDNGLHNKYHYSSERQEVISVGVPRLVSDTNTIEVGCWVKRGEHWGRGSEDGNADHGVVVRKHRDQTVTVKWPIGICERYRFGKDHLFEVEVKGSEAALTEDIASDGEHQAMAPSSAGNGEVLAVWQFQDNTQQWRTLNLENSEKLETFEQSKKSGTTLINHKDMQMRFDVNKLKYRDQASNSAGEIRRIIIPQDEYQTLMAVENAV